MGDIQSWGMSWLDKLRSTAQRATKGPWYFPGDGREIVKDRKGGFPVDSSIGASQGGHDHAQALANCAHIARWDPDTALLVVEVLEAAEAFLTCNAMDVTTEMAAIRRLKAGKDALRAHVQGGGETWVTPATLP